MFTGAGGLYDKGPTFQLWPPLMQKAAHAYGPIRDKMAAQCLISNISRPLGQPYSYAFKTYMLCIK